MDLKKTKLAKVRRVFDLKNLSTFVFAILAFSLTWSTAKVIQKNYLIQKDIATAHQENEIWELENQKLKYQIEYYKTDAYLEQEARRKFNKAAAGEKVVIFPRPASDENDTKNEVTTVRVDRTQEEAGSWTQNLKDWRDFLFLRNGD